MTDQDHEFEAKHVLITGFPALLPGALARHILDDTSKPTVYLFVDKSNKSTGQAFRNSLPRSKRSRLTLVEGRQDTVELEMSGTQVRSLTEKVDMIFCESL